MGDNLEKDEGVSYGDVYVKSDSRYFAYSGMDQETCITLATEITGKPSVIITEQEYKDANPDTGNKNV